jgi:dienelactone hydrolase
MAEGIKRKVLNHDEAYRLRKWLDAVNAQSPELLTDGETPADKLLGAAREDTKIPEMSWRSIQRAAKQAGIRLKAKPEARANGRPRKTDKRRPPIAAMAAVIDHLARVTWDELPPAAVLDDLRQVQKWLVRQQQVDQSADVPF